MNRLLLLSALLISSACESPGSDPADNELTPVGLINDSVLVDNEEREFILYVPENLDPEKSVPLLLTFHGYTNSAENIMNYSGFNELADSMGFIVAYPQGSLLNGNTHWNVGGWTLASTADDIMFVNTLIDSITARYAIDTDRIYANGMSNGGYMSFLLACTEDERFAAVASVTGAMTPQTMEKCDPSGPVPVLQFHADTDETVPYNGGEAWTIGIPEVVAYWSQHNGTADSPVITQLEDLNKEDQSTVERHVYQPDETYAPVIHYFISGGGHEWPGVWGNKDINATEIIWDFFEQFDRNGTR